MYNVGASSIFSVRAIEHDFGVIRNSKDSLEITLAERDVLNRIKTIADSQLPEPGCDVSEHGAFEVGFAGLDGFARRVDRSKAYLQRRLKEAAPRP